MNELTTTNDANLLTFVEHRQTKTRHLSISPR